MIQEVIKSMLSKLDTMLEFDEGISVNSVEELKNKFDIYVKPIPLTAKILEKNGFGYIEKDVNSYEDKVLSHFYLGDECFCANMDLHIGTYNDGVFWLNSLKVSLNGIRYLHELQHAIRLAGIDKEIKL